MGFSTLDPQLDTLHIATRTQCNKDPSCSLLIACLIQIIDSSKSKLDHFEKNRGNDDERRKLNTKILSLFHVVFAYLSSRTNDFEKRDLLALDKKAFIPCEVRGKVPELSSQHRKFQQLLSLILVLFFLSRSTKINPAVVRFFSIDVIYRGFILASVLHCCKCVKDNNVQIFCFLFFGQSIWQIYINIPGYSSQCIIYLDPHFSMMFECEQAISLR